MKKSFNIYGKVTVTTFTTVEAENAEEALKLASKRRGMMSVTSNNGDFADNVWKIEELDGEPYEIKIEED